jgi:hypothetical protein
MADLHCFSDDVDTVIAASVEDADAAYDEWAGGDTGQERARWTQLPDDKPLTITVDPELNRGRRVTKTCAEWVASNGRGFLCSTEY